MFELITDEELKGKGVIGQPTIPGLSAEKMQESIEQVVREIVIPAFNNLIHALASGSAAQNIGAQMPEEADDADGTVQAALEKLEQIANAHAQNTENPHAVTAGQTGAYSKQETDARINERVVAIGAGDMVKSVYDPDGKAKPYIPLADALDKSTYKGSEDGVVKAADKLKTPINIGNAQFDGSESVTLEEMGAEPAFEKKSAFNKDFGSVAGTVCQGNDGRLSDARRASNITMSYNGNLYIAYS